MCWRKSCDGCDFKTGVAPEPVIEKVKATRKRKRRLMNETPED